MKLGIISLASKERRMPGTDETPNLLDLLEASLILTYIRRELSEALKATPREKKVISSADFSHLF